MLSRMSIPPPFGARAQKRLGDPVPPVIVKPSRIVADPSPLVQTTTDAFNPDASIVVTASPPELCRRTALPLKLIDSW